MVVDDQPINRMIIARLVEAIENGLPVITFGNPLDALAHAADDTPDLLITDYKMSPFDGDEFIRRFRRVPACDEVPVIVITAHQEFELRDRAVQAGSTEYFLAPIDHEEFRVRCRQILAQSRRRHIGRISAGAGEGTRGSALPRAAVSDPQELTEGEAIRALNDQFASVLAELESAKSDLNNLLDISGLAVVFVDGDLRIRRFTPRATSIFRLGPTDLGRRLPEIATYLDYGYWERDFKRVVTSLTATEGHLVTLDGDAYYLMRITPYRRSDGSIDGAAFSFTKMGA